MQVVLFFMDHPKILGIRKMTVRATPFLDLSTCDIILCLVAFFFFFLLLFREGREDWMAYLRGGINGVLYDWIKLYLT